MAAVGVASSSPGPSSVPAKEKPVVVRVKRKASQARLDAFWLEINERPIKKPLLNIEKLSISDHGSHEQSTTKRLLVQHVETVSPSEAVENILQSILPDSNRSKDLSKKIEERRGHFKPNKKQDQLRSMARQKHVELVRNARFQQIWRSRKGEVESEVDSLRHLCHLYDVVRVDSEDQKSRRRKERHISLEDNAILCNYLPLLREYVPSAAMEIESEMKSYLSSEVLESDPAVDLHKEDGYVYDLYTVEDDFTGTVEDMPDSYPLVQVNNEDGFDDMPELEYDSEDSNAEDNPRNDYPDEESSTEEDEDVDPFGDFDCDEIKKQDDVSDEEGESIHVFSDSECSNSQYEDEVLHIPGEDEENWRWRYR